MFGCCDHTHLGDAWGKIFSEAGTQSRGLILHWPYQLMTITQESWPLLVYGTACILIL